MGANPSRNQVFARSDFTGVVGALQAAKKAGKAVMTTTELVTRDNDWWGLAGGGRVRVCWVYLERVADWENELDHSIRNKIRRGNHSWLAHGPFHAFPNYATAGDNFLDLVELTAEQVNLLADLTCWGVTENAAVFRDVLAPG